MNNERKLKLLAEVLDMEEDVITPEIKLSELDEWDSIALISFIAMMDDEFNKMIKGSDVKKQKTVADLMNLMEN